MSIRIGKEQKLKAGGNPAWSFPVAGDSGKLLNFKILRRSSAKRKLRLYEQLDLLISSGLDLENSLLLLRSEAEGKAKEFELLNHLIEQIISGKSLSESMRERAEFSEYEYFSIEVGEETGKLEAVIHNLSLFYTELIEQRKKLLSALSYPAIVLCVAVAAVYFLLSFVVPLFKDVFQRFDSDLPFLTRVIISWSEKLSIVVPLLVLSALIISLLYYQNRKKEFVRSNSAKLILNTPIIGLLVKKIYMARLFNALSLLVSSKNPLLHSIGLIKKMVGFYPLERSLAKMEEGIFNGKSLYQCMEEDKFFDRQIVALVRVSEEVGQLETVLIRINLSLSREINQRMNTIGSLLEPILIVLVGGIVAVILVAMYLPLFDLSTSVY